ncbi:hypothetical protein AB0C52_06610 [Streptomyces sp. NPDC048717]|uniref:hypothetical protein n=1 Tax=Streptomyces sp. NPDC048717 TaxID=3154928 RepID=UPI00343991B5
MNAVVEVVRPVFGGWVCVLDPGHGGPHRDRAGDAWWVRLETAGAASGAAGGPEPEYRSPRCLVGRHALCRDGVPGEADDVVPGVRFLVCGCPCHGGQ